MTPRHLVWGLACLAMAACGAAAAPKRSTARTHAPAATHHGGRQRQATTEATSTSTPRSVAPRRPAHPVLLRPASTTGPTPFVPAVRWRGQTAAWVARTPALTLLSFNQRLVELHLHSGSVDAGTTGWHWGDMIAHPERRTIVAAFNGAFKFVTGAGGFMSYGRVGSPLQTGAGSVVTYADGFTDIGTWRAGVPAAGRRVVSVRQNLHLLISAGHAGPDVGCNSCWGATLGGVADPARSALGITADGRLIWAGGEHLTVSALADGLLSAHVVRAVELDINPEWVAGYLYLHRPTSLAAVQQVAGQPGVPGQFFTPYSRDFFVMQAR